MSKTVKIFAIVVGIIIVLILAFTYLGNSSNTATSSTPADTGLSSSVPMQTAATSTGEGAEAAPISNANFTILLSSIKSITLDTSIFSNPGYKALRDNPISLGTAVIGRQNPFAPIGVDSTTGQSTGTLAVQTLTPTKVTATTAQFGALVSAGSMAGTSVVFQYGTDDTLSSATGPVNVTSTGTALFNVTGLTPATTYYVNTTAVQGSNTATGTIMTFTTPKK